MIITDCETTNKNKQTNWPFIERSLSKRNEWQLNILTLLQVDYILVKKKKKENKIYILNIASTLTIHLISTRYETNNWTTDGQSQV